MGNVKYEQGYAKDRTTLINTMCDAYNHGARQAAHANDKTPPEVLNLVNRPLQCFSYGMREETTYQLVVDLWRVGENLAAHKSETGSWRLQLSGSADDPFINVYETTWTSDGSSEFPQERLIFKFLLPHIGFHLPRGQIGPHEAILAGEAAETLSDRYRHYVNATSGFASDVSDQFARMVYFSAVTISTLGFGDIVPITKLQDGGSLQRRSMEWFSIGFFLNSLAKEYGSTGALIEELIHQLDQGAYASRPRIARAFDELKQATIMARGVKLSDVEAVAPRGSAISTPEDRF